MSYVIHFDNEPPSLLHTLLAWLLLIGIFCAWFVCCVAPVSRDIGEAMLRQIEKEKAEKAAKEQGR